MPPPWEHVSERFAIVAKNIQTLSDQVFDHNPAEDHANERTIASTSVFQPVSSNYNPAIGLRVKSLIEVEEKEAEHLTAFHLSLQQKLASPSLSSSSSSEGGTENASSSTSTASANDNNTSPSPRPSVSSREQAQGQAQTLTLTLAQAREQVQPTFEQLTARINSFNVECTQLEALVDTLATDSGLLVDAHTRQLARTKAQLEASASKGSSDSMAQAELQKTLLVESQGRLVRRDPPRQMVQ